MRQIRTDRYAAFASDHELANELRRMEDEGEYVKRNLVVSEALSRGISTEQLREIR
jgi:hypothetical protein